MRHLSFFILLSFFLTFAAIFSHASERRSINKATFAIQSERAVHIQLEMNESVLPSISQLGGKSPRIILDFEETVYRTPNTIRVADNTIVRSLRFGLHYEPLKTRMVIDLVGDCEIKKPIITEEENGVSIFLSCDGADINNTSKEKTSEKSTETEVETVHTPKQVSDSVGMEEEKERTVESPIIEKDTVSEDGAIETSSLQQVPAKNSDGESSEIIPLEASEGKSQDEKVAGPQKNDSKQEEQDTLELEDSLMLMEISYSRFEDKDEEQVLFYLNNFTPPHVSSVEKEKLLVVCEFNKVHLSSNIEKLITTGGKYVVSIETLEKVDPQTITVTLELSAAHDYDLQQVFYKNDNVFSLIITGQPVEPIVE